MKKTLINISLAALAIATIAMTGCVQDPAKVFELDGDSIAVGPEGGVRKIRVNASEKWIASTDSPWITVSPANGNGSVDCQIIIDSTLINEKRTGYVLIQSVSSMENSRSVEIGQDGFPYAITLEKSDVEVDNFAPLDDRNFEIKVRTNVDFDVKIPDNAGWLTHKDYKVTLDRGVRPREVTIRFDWKVNSRPDQRPAQVEFVPKNGELTLAQLDKLNVVQEAAAPIKENSREGDSVALLGIARALNTWGSWENGTSMDFWDDVVLWERGMEDYTPEKEGRVKYARFFIFQTKEPIPYEVQYLTAAEELVFYSNANSFLIDEMNEGEYISKLTQLKRLTIGAYGLTELTENFKNLENLEYLNLSGNNFQKVPAVITPGNFKKLHSLNINGNQRKMIYDLSNTVYTNFGGLYEEPDGFPKRLLEWEKLDTLVISVNYLHGSIPDMKAECPPYTQADLDAANAIKADSLPSFLVTNSIPKVLPNMKHLAINLNRLTGNVPEWILYHPALDWWIPYIFIFSQEGKDVEGKSAGFDNEPANLNYYYKLYPYKQRYDDEEDGGGTESNGSGDGTAK